MASVTRRASAPRALEMCEINMAKNRILQAQADEATSTVRLHYGARRDERVHGASVPSRSRERERRVVLGVSRVDVRARRDQRLHGLRVPLLNRKHQCCFAEGHFAGVDVSSCRDQCVQDDQISIITRDDRRCVYITAAKRISTISRELGDSYR